ncbi:MAG: hypothetical protein KA354_17400 [Phycisphaerae bacterium]|nr:hypothetical protein [Phycisphaerae bacterium]
MTDPVNPTRPSLPAASWARCWPYVIPIWIVTLALGAVHAWSVRHAMDTDSISYMEIADTYLRRDWAHIWTGHWSPFYPWLIAITKWIMRPSLYAEATLAHLLGVVLLACSMGGFHYFWAGLVRHGQARCSAKPIGQDDGLPDWAWWTLGYTLFIWCSLVLIGMHRVTPDLCLTVWIYLAAGVLVRIRDGGGSIARFLVLGILLGLGYLTKAAMLPLAVVFLVAAVFCARPRRRVFPRVAVGLLGLVLVAGPWIWGLSSAKGRLSWGDAGRTSYVLYVDNVPSWDFWHGHSASSEVPEAPRLIYDRPPARPGDCRLVAYEFATPLPGSFPLWYDPSHWWGGVVPFVNVAGQIATLKASLETYADMFVAQMGVVTFGVIVLLALSSTGLAVVRSLIRQWWILAPPLAAMAMYGLVVVETRYLGGFVMLLWGGLFVVISLRDSCLPRSLVRVVCVLALVVLGIGLGWRSVVPFKSALGDLRGDGGAIAHSQWHVAQGLQAMGLRPGDRVAHVGSSIAWYSYWARLAQARIIAEVRPRDSYWLAGDSVRSRINGAFAKAGASAIVTRRFRSSESPWGQPAEFPSGWRQVGKSDFFVYFLGDQCATRDASMVLSPRDAVQ